MQIASEAMRQFVVSLYQSGEHTQQSIAQTVGTTQSNVSKILKAARRNGIVLPKRTRGWGSVQRTPTFQASQLGSRGASLNLDYL